jgi:hypothetical protein
LQTGVNRTYSKDYKKSIEKLDPVCSGQINIPITDLTPGISEVTK